jgi:hypothetical protein
MATSHDEPACAAGAHEGPSMLAAGSADGGVCLLSVHGAKVCAGQDITGFGLADHTIGGTPRKYGTIRRAKSVSNPHVLEMTS